MTTRNNNLKNHYNSTFIGTGILYSDRNYINYGSTKAITEKRYVFIPI